MEHLNFKVLDFEGPLDLLLVLIRKNKVSIYDIPINLIVEQYFSVMEQMKEYDLEISSEFIVLAATLLQIKSSMLLPKPETEEEEGDPREELVRRLEEYKRVKAAAVYLDERKHIGDSYFFKEPDDVDQAPPIWNYSKLTPENLVLAYKQAYQKMERKLPPPKRSFEGIVGHEKVSVRSRAGKIWARIKRRGKMLFKELFTGGKTRAEAVASFLAVLEMVKRDRIRIEYDESGSIANPMVTCGADIDGDLSLSEFEE